MIRAWHYEQELLASISGRRIIRNLRVYQHEIGIGWDEILYMHQAGMLVWKYKKFRLRKGLSFLEALSALKILREHTLDPSPRDAANFSIKAQSGTASTGNGGDLTIQSGRGR